MKRQFLNKKANFNYNILNTIEAGVVLTGEEIKAIRAGRVSLANSYAKITNGEIFWLGGNINGISQPDRTKKLLLHKNELNKLIGLVNREGMTLIPIKLYLKNGKAKIELGLGRGKKKYDKREAIRRRDQEKEVARKIKKF
jgi:SsrA-binding protein